MRELPTRPLERIVDLVTSKVGENKDLTLPYVGLEHIPSGGTGINFGAAAADSISTNNVFRPGDILFGKLRPRLRKCVRVQRHGYCSTDLMVLRPRDDVNGAFAGYLLQSDAVFAEAIRTEEGTKMPRCSWSTLRRFEVFFPEDGIQHKRIAEVLTTVDEAIKQTEALIAKMQQIKAGVMHDLFTRGVGEDGQLRSGRESSSSTFGPVPLGWQVGSLLDVADSTRQPILTGPFGADLGRDDFVPDGVPLLRIGNVQAGYLDLSDLVFISPSKAKELGRYAVRTGDLLFARQGATTGRNALASANVDGCIINYHIIRVALDHDRCAPLFIEAAFNEQMVLRQVERDKGRGTREGINSAQLVALQLPLAPVPEQRRIAAILGGMQTRVGALKSQLAKLCDLRRGLMADLLSGRVQVPPAGSAP